MTDHSANPADPNLHGKPAPPEFNGKASATSTSASGRGERCCPGTSEWEETQAIIEALTRGWFYLEPLALFERELDAQGNEEEPRCHGRFSNPGQVIAFIQDMRLAQATREATRELARNRA